MSGELLTVILVAGPAAAASLLGGLIALWRTPTTFYMSLALGFAAGSLIGTICFEMLPQAIEMGSLWIAAAGFTVGFGTMYGFDLFINRGRVAGEHAEQQEQVRRFHLRRRPLGGEVTVLAGGTSAEELIEGISIGVGVAIGSSLGIVVAAGIAMDNVAEALSIGQLIRDEEGRGDGEDGGQGGRGRARRVLGWTGLIAAALFVSALAGWLLLRGLPPPILASLLAVGGGAMLYLTVTDLVPESAERQYQQSAALATGAGFLAVLILSHLV